MIEVSKKKLMLIPVTYEHKSLVTEKTAFIRVNGRTQCMYIASNAAHAMGMDGMWYRLFFDVNSKVIAWQLTNELNKGQMESKTWKMAKKNVSGQIAVAIGRIMKAMEIDTEKNYKLEVKKSVVKNDLMQDGDYYFISFEDEQV